MPNTKKKKLSQNDYLKLLGLFTLYVNLIDQLDPIIEAVADITDLEGNDAYDRGGYLVADNSCDKNSLSEFKKELKALFTIQK